MNELLEQPDSVTEVALSTAMIEQLHALPIPRLHDWFGPWCIEPVFGNQLLEMAKTTDWAKHLAEYKASEYPGDLTYVMEWNSSEYRLAAREEDVAAVAERGGVAIAVVNVAGTLMKSSGSLGTSSGTVALRTANRNIANDPNIDGCLQIFDTPGGTVSGTADWAESIAYLAGKKLTYGMAEDLCASAGLWGMSQCEKVFAANATTKVGSSGTVICLYDTSGRAAMTGIEAKVYATGPLKGAGLPGTKITAAQDQYFNDMVQETQGHFRAALAAGRKMNLSQAKALETGGIFSAKEAVQNGLLDGIQSIDQTLSMMFREIKSRRKAAAQTSKGISNMATKELATSVQEKIDETVVAPVDRASVISEMNVFVARFGAENGTKWFGENLKLEEALGRHCEALTAKLEGQAIEFKAALLAKDAEIGELATRLSQIAVGEKTGVSQVDAEKSTSVGVDATGRPVNARERAIAANKADMAAVTSAKS